MFRHLRPAIASFALAAMLLRALLPEGWMPNPTGLAGTPVVLCTAYGMQHIVLDQDGKPAKPSDSKHSDVCPFAAAAHFAPPAADIGIPLPCHASAPIACLRPTQQTAKARFLRHAIAPRAPPLSA